MRTPQGLEAYGVLIGVSGRINCGFNLLELWNISLPHSYIHHDLYTIAISAR